MQVQKVVRCHFSCSAQVTSSSDGGVVGSGARVEVMGEIGLEVGKDEADEAESGVEAAAGSCGVKQCTAVKRRKRWNANDRRIDVIAATVESALEPENEVERKRASERRGDLGCSREERIPEFLLCLLHVRCSDWRARRLRQWFTRPVFRVLIVETLRKFRSVEENFSSYIAMY